MTHRPENPYPADIRLLLRSHGEQLWLASQVGPVLSQLEQTHAIPEDQLGAALAYLEVLWIGARRRAAETDAAFAALLAAELDGGLLLGNQARQYHKAVRVLRDAVARHVAGHTCSAAPGASLHRHAVR